MPTSAEEQAKRAKKLQNERNGNFNIYKNFPRIREYFRENEQLGKVKLFEKVPYGCGVR